MLDAEITECPFCGSVEEYTYIVTRKYLQTRGFSNASTYDYADTDIGVDHHGACKCSECGKIIKARE